MKGGDVRLKQWKCVQAEHHKEVAEVIQERQRDGWRLHTYTAATLYLFEIRHYLLFERGSDE